LTETPPPGKMWLTIEVDSDTPQARCEAYAMGHPIVNREFGPDPEDPSDKCNRLLGEAEEKFRITRTRFPHGTPYDVGQCLADGADLLAQALKVLREEL